MTTFTPSELKVIEEKQQELRAKLSAQRQAKPSSAVFKEHETWLDFIDKTCPQLYLETDFCSFSPDGSLQDPTLFRPACFVHDLFYRYGHIYAKDVTQKKADELLRDYMKETGHEELAKLYYTALDMFGHVQWNNWRSQKPVESKQSTVCQCHDKQKSNSSNLWTVASLTLVGVIAAVAIVAAIRK